MSHTLSSRLVSVTTFAIDVKCHVTLQTKAALFIIPTLNEYHISTYKIGQLPMIVCKYLRKYSKASGVKFFEKIFRIFGVFFYFF